MGLALSILFIFLILPFAYGYSKAGKSGIAAVLLVFAWFGIPGLIYGYISEIAGLIVLSIEVAVMLGYAIYCQFNK